MWTAGKVAGKGVKGPARVVGKGVAGKGVATPADPTDPATKVRRTIAWLNHNGGLAAEINYKAVKSSVESCDPSQVLKILHGLKQKGAEIKDPTQWLKTGCSKHAPELDQRVKKSIAYFNHKGGLQQPIMYKEVKGPLAQLPSALAMKLLKGLEDKGAQITNPTAWVLGAVQKCIAGGKFAHKAGSSAQVSGSGNMGVGKSFQTQVSGAVKLDNKVTQTIVYYNKSGVLPMAIDYAAVAPALASMPPAEAIKVLKGMDGKNIRNPTGWINGAVTKMMGGGK